MRMFNAIRDNLSISKLFTQITNGSGGGRSRHERKRRRYYACFERCKYIWEYTIVRVNSTETCVAMEMDDTKLGFTHLRLLHCNNNFILKICEQVEIELYLSSQLCKSMFMGTSKVSDMVHWPRLSDKNDVLDLALTLHSRQWTSIANQWVTRSNGSWPSSDVKSQIIDHGVLFVPIGSKGSTNEHIEWRISFSVGEKLLIYSFTHTQLLCYALMKILIKDVVNKDHRCTDLICSFHITKYSLLGIRRVSSIHMTTRKSHYVFLGMLQKTHLLLSIWNMSSLLYN